MDNKSTTEQHKDLIRASVTDAEGREWRLMPVEATREMCLADWPSKVTLSDAHTDWGVSEVVWREMGKLAPRFEGALGGEKGEARKYDDVLVPFVAAMRKELHANTRKGDRPGWLAMDANTALLEVYWHAAKLSAAVKNNDGPAIQEHSADVANMAMMVLDICGGLAWVDTTGEQ